MQETIITSIVITTLVFLVLLIALVVVINRFYVAKLNAERETYKAIVEAQEREREIIARDIHDDLGGLITSAKLSISAIRGEKDPGALNEGLAHLNNIMEMATIAAKNASNALTPSAISNYGLKSAIEDISGRYRWKQIEFDIQLNYTIELSDFMQINIYRIVLEIVNNSVKYAEGDRIYISLTSTNPQTLSLVIGDNGKGFNFEKLKGTRGKYGLQNIENRCTMLNGKLRFESGENNGSKFIIDFQV